MKAYLPASCQDLVQEGGTLVGIMSPNQLQLQGMLENNNEHFQPLFFFKIKVMPYSMWDFSSPTRDWTCVPCIGSAES